MPLFDAFKKKKEVKKEEKKEVVKDKPSKPSLFLVSPHVTEKATDSGEKNKYVFKVLPKANKKEIKKDVEDSYNVDVESVNIINVPRKKRRLGRQEGWKKGYKKAIVKVKKGQKIEILPR